VFAKTGSGTSDAKSGFHITNPTLVSDMGRSARSPIDILRTLVWLAYLKVLSGLPTGYAIGRQIEGAGAQPRAWINYDNAKAVPLNGKRPGVAVARAERLWPDSALIFMSPLWKALSGERLTRREVDVGLIWLGPKVVSIFFEQRKDGLWYRRVFELSQMCLLWEMHSFAGLAASVFLMAEAELAHSPILREAGFEIYEILRPHVAVLPELAEVYPYLFTCIDSMMPRWLCFGTNGRKDVRFCWQHERWASDFDEKTLRFPWLMNQLDTGPAPNLDEIRYTRKFLKYGSSTYPLPPSHQISE